MSSTLDDLSSTNSTSGFVVEGTWGAVGDRVGLGIEVSSIGDFNGDGAEDFTVSAPGYDGTSAGRADAGGLYIIYGGSDLAARVTDGRLDLSPVPASNLGELAGSGLLVLGARPDDILSGTGAGDVNGDGFDDVFMTAPSFVEATNPVTGDPVLDHRPGTAYILYGGPTAEALVDPATGVVDLAALPAATPGTPPAVTVIHGEADTLRTGLSFAAGGDLNGDGLADVALGTFQASGDLYLPDGSTLDFPDIPGLPTPPIGSDGRVYAIYGQSTIPAEIDLATDIVAGDGSQGFFTRGFVETVSDGAGGFEPDFIGAIGFFDTLAMADLDGNGRDELLLGSPFGGTLQGVVGAEAPYPTGGVFILNFGTQAAPAEVMLPNQMFLQGERLGEMAATGMRLANLGDINDDGIDDIAIRAPMRDEGSTTNNGAVYGILGAESFFAPLIVQRRDLTTVMDFRILGNAQGDAADPAFDDEDDPQGSGLLVSDISAAGDVNGDGVDDFAVGFGNARGADGAVYIVLGRTGADSGPTSDLVGFDEILRFDDFQGQGREEFGIARLDGARAEFAGAAISGPIDLDGSGTPQLLIGAPGPLTAQDDGSQLASTDGRVYVVSPLFAEAEVGQLLTGSAAAERLEGGDGPDTIRGLDGADTLVGGAGDDELVGGVSTLDLRDVIFAGDGDDSVSGGHGNDELYGMGGNDTMEGGFGVDRLVGGDGDDVLTGSAFSDQIFGNDGFDFINGGFGSDRVNGGAGADRFFHIGSAGHGSDWIQDYSAAEGDVLVYGGAAGPANFQVNITNTAGAGDAGVDEAFVVYTPTGQILWALVDGAGEAEITLRLGGVDYDLLA